LASRAGYGQLTTPALGRFQLTAWQFRRARWARIENRRALRTSPVQPRSTGCAPKWADREFRPADRASQPRSAPRFSNTMIRKKRRSAISNALPSSSPARSRSGTQPGTISFDAAPDRFRGPSFWGLNQYLVPGSRELVGRPQQRHCRRQAGNRRFAVRGDGAPRRGAQSCCRSGGRRLAGWEGDGSDGPHAFKPT